MHVHATMLFMMRTVLNIFLWIFHNKVNSKDIVWYYCNCPHRDFAQKAKFREGTLVTRAYIKESTYSWNSYDDVKTENPERNA